MSKSLKNSLDLVSFLLDSTLKVDPGPKPPGEQVLAYYFDRKTVQKMATVIARCRYDLDMDRADALIPPVDDLPLGEPLVARMPWLSDEQLSSIEKEVSLLAHPPAYALAAAVDTFLLGAANLFVLQAALAKHRRTYGKEPEVQP